MFKRVRLATLVLSTILGGGLLAPAVAQTPKPQRLKQTKRVGQTQMQWTIDGEPEKTIERAEEYLLKEPNHLESLFNLTVAWAQMNEPEKAALYMQRAIAAGIPPERFIAGPRRMLAPLTETPEFRQLQTKLAGRLIHGPMLGCVTDRGAKFWVRTADEAPIQIVLSDSKDMTRPIRSATVTTEADRDYTGVAEVSMLRPNTRYYYDVLLRGKSAIGGELRSFRTFPTAGKPARFQIGFGGGAGYTPQFERMWDTIAGHDLIAFLLLGDNVYIDNPTRPDMQHYTYYRRQSRPEYRRFAAGTSIFAIWDDHDFGVNDSFYGNKIKDPAWKVPVWKVFRNNWNNPSYGGGERQPGCWFKMSIGEVDFFMLDCRFYRTNPKEPKPGMLGRAQKEWLKKELRYSTAKFKVLASSVPWVLEAKGNSLDTWRGFQEEREEIFSYIEEKRIDGVVLLSADRHRSDYWRIDREKGYPLYEFESSRLTNVHTHPIMPGSLFGYNAKCSVGLLTFDTTKPDPELTYEIRNIDDKLIHTVVIRLSAITSAR